MTETITPKRHRWTKDELAHLNRIASHSKNKTEAFKKVADEMGVSWTSVRSTYFNHNKPKASKPQAKTAIKRTPSFAKKVSSSGLDLAKLSDTELFDVWDGIKVEAKRRREMFSSIG